MTTRNSMEKDDGQMSPEAILKAPRVFAYTDYRTFIRDFYRYKKSLNPRYSYRLLNRQVGMKSNNYMKLIVDGYRRLKTPYAMKLIEVMGLSSDEAAYFLNLMHVNDTKETAVKDLIWKDLKNQTQNVDLHEFSDQELAVATQWYVTVIMELIRLPDFENNPNWIFKRLGGRISVYHIKESIQLLKKVGLVTENDGRLEVTNQLMFGGKKIPKELLNAIHFGFHRAGLWAIKNVDSAQREFNSATVTLPKAKLQEYKSKIRQFYQKLLEESLQEGPGEELFQVNLQFFPLTSEVPHEKK